MTDEEFFEKFEDATLSVEIFDHKHHVKMAWIYLKKYSLAEALERFSNALRKFAKANGAENIYHETITFAFLTIINERMKTSETMQNWDNFERANPDIFDWKKNILKKYYREETLKSDFAKKNFVFPDKIKEEY